MTRDAADRVAAGVLLCAMLALAPGVVSRALESTAVMPGWWDAALFAGFAIAAGGLARCFKVPSDPRMWAGLIACLTLVGVVTFPLVATAPLPGGEPPWVAMLAPTAAGALGIALDWVPALASGVVLATAQALAQSTSVWPATDYGETTDFVFLVVCAISVAAGMEALRSRAHQVEVAEGRTRAATVWAGRQVAEEREEVRWTALMHDEVLATLSAASSGQVPVTAVHRMAEDAIRAFEDRHTGAYMPVTELVDGLERIAVRADAVVALAQQCGGAEVLPGDVGRSLVAAASEAVRNARRHAGTGASLAIQCTINPADVTIAVRDDGVGFDPATVDTARMGVAVSIVGRMAAVGGVAEISSSPGLGTIITLRWVRGAT